MAFGGGSGRGIKNDINVTPLVDVVLVLLIIFMVVTPMLQRGKDVKLPKSQHADEEGKRVDPLIVSMTADKHIWVESAQVDEPGLEGAIASALKAQPGRQVLLKGDQSLTVGDVRKIFQRLQSAGGKGVQLGVEQVKK